jgi:hypothetical protein
MRTMTWSDCKVPKPHLRLKSVQDGIYMSLLYGYFNSSSICQMIWHLALFDDKLLC